MTHFRVLAIADDDEDLENVMAPYQENNMGDCPMEFMEFTSVTEEEKEWFDVGRKVVTCKDTGVMYETGIWTYRDMKYLKEIQSPGDESERGELYVDTKMSDEDIYKTHNLVEQVVSWKFFVTFEEFMELSNYKKNPDDPDDWGYYENPNAKWDYWRILTNDGRKDIADYLEAIKTTKITEASERYDKYNLLKERNGGDANSEEFRIAVWEYTKDEKDSWMIWIGGEEKDAILSSKEEYIKWYTTLRPLSYAIAAKEGWYERGDLGWWAISTNEKPDFDENWWTAVSLIDPEKRVYFLDCHI